MTRATTLRGTFKCECGNRTCEVLTRYIRCPRCGRLYRFGEYVDMLEACYPKTLRGGGRHGLA